MIETNVIYCGDNLNDNSSFEVKNCYKMLT